jgi:major outer membrane protein
MSGLKLRGRSRIKSLSWHLMGASSYLCLALLLGRPAPALAGNTDPPPAIFDSASAPFREHWFFSLEGGYAANASPSNLGFSPTDPYLSYLSPLRPGGNGGFVGGTIGHTMGPEWDAALSYHATLLGKSNENITASPPPAGFVTSNALTASASSGLWYQTFDAEVGYHPPAWLAENVRLFFGPRILTAHSSINYGFNDSGTDFIGVPGTFDKLGNFSHDIDLAGIGPRAGFEASVPLAFTTAPITFDISGAGSAIFTLVQDSYSYSSSAVTPTVTGGAESEHHPIVYGLEGKAGLSYHMNGSTTLEAGYQVEQWYNLATSVSLATDTGTYQGGHSSVLSHGPFGKITVELP